LRTSTHGHILVGEVASVRYQKVSLKISIKVLCIGATRKPRTLRHFIIRKNWFILLFSTRG